MGYFPLTSTDTYPEPQGTAVRRAAANLPRLDRKITVAISSRLLLPFLLVLASSSTTAAVLASSGGLTHIHLVVHETYKGANATAITPVASPLGSVAVLDDELRVGRDRASELLGRFQGLVVGTGGLEGGGATNYVTSVTFVFTAGEYRGSTLSVVGSVLGFEGAIERPVVAGTGKFRMARGYSMLKLPGNPTPETVLFEVDLFVLVHRGKY